MRPLLLITRPAEESARTACAASQAGFDTLAAPLMHIESIAWQLPAGDFDSLLFTSPQGPRHAVRYRALIDRLPVYAVGAATAKAAAASGFQPVAIGDRDASAIVSQAATSGCRAMLHVAGADAAAISLSAGLRLTRIAVYRAILAAVFPPPALSALQKQSVFATLLYSPRTAQRFAALADAAALDRGRLRIVSISPAVAAAAGTGWAACVSAEMPSTDALLAAARALWQGNSDG